jgi:hypothetical protein
MKSDDSAHAFEIKQHNDPLGVLSFMKYAISKRLLVVITGRGKNFKNIAEY